MPFTDVLPGVVGVAESASDPAFTETSEVADAKTEAGSSFISISMLDCDWTAGLPFAARSYKKQRTECDIFAQRFPKIWNILEMNESLGMLDAEKSFWITKNLGCMFYIYCIQDILNWIKFQFLSGSVVNHTFDFPNGTKYTKTVIKINYLHVVKHQLPTHCRPL